MDVDWDNMPIIDFSLFPNSMITNLELNEIMEILNKPEERNEQQSQIPEDAIAEMDALEIRMKSASSSKQEREHSKRFVNFLIEKQIEVDLKTISKERLNGLLRWFYKELKTKKNEYYSPQSLRCIRAGIHRYLTISLNRNVNIISGEEFSQANRMLTTMSALWLSNGGRPTEYVSIEENDLSKIHKSFTRETADSLQNEVIFSILYFLGARGREEFRRLRRSDISICTDSEGQKFVKVSSKDSDNIRKNTRPSLKLKEYSSIRIGRIYDTRAIEAIEIYLKLLSQGTPDSDNLFPRPLSNKNNKLIFSRSQVRGEHWLGDFMKTLSKKLKLSKMYTNHCIRCTTITIGKEKGLTNQEIALLTGHKDAASIDGYDRPSDSRKRRIASVLSNNEPNNQKRHEDEPEETITRTVNTEQVNQMMNMVAQSTGNTIQIFNNCTVNF